MENSKVSQKSKVKMQNDKSKFKKEFSERLVKFSINTIKFAEIARNKKAPYSLIDQLIRSATSIGANVIEARASSSRKDYIRFFEIALKFANETLYWLILFKEVLPEYINNIDCIYREAEEISKIIATSILTLKGKK